MNKKAIISICIPSAIAFFIMLASGRIASLTIAFLVGIIFGGGEYRWLSKNRIQHSKWQQVLSVLIGIFVCYAAAQNFYNIWIPSVNLMRTIVTKIFSDYECGLFVISIIVGLAALPFITLLIRIILPYIVRFLRFFDYKRLKSELINNISCSSVLKKVSVIALHLALSALIGTALLFCVYMIPTDRINLNVRNSANIIEEEGAYPHLSEWFTSELDNFTDSIMMLEAANDRVISPLVDAMNVPRGDIEEYSPDKVLTSHYIDGTGYDRLVNYPRYWHGYLIFLKPLFLFFNYSAIRTINGIFQFLLVLFTCYLLCKNSLKEAVIPYILSYGMLMPLALAKAFQYSSCFYVLTIGSISLLLLSKSRLRTESYIVFLYCGILTAFFDFLTYPIATFGVPMVFFLLLTGTDSAESKISNIIKNGIIWCVGFAGMWVAKWIIGSVITGNNVIVDGLTRVAIRTSSESVDGAVQYGIFDCELKNLKAFFTTPFTVCVIFCVGYLIYGCVKNKQNSLKKTLRILAPFLLTGLAPAVWYTFATNHSVIHAWFTNKAWVTSLLAVLFGLVCLHRSGNLNTKESKIGP